MGTNTGLGIGIGIPFKNNALGGDKPYFPPELKARMIGVWTSYGKKNTDADRNIIKNKIPNAGGDLEILNSAYKLNSGFGEYKVDFLDWVIYSPFINERTSFTFSSSNDTNKDIITIYQRVPAATQSFKIKAKLRGSVLYRYYVNKGDTISVSYYEVKEGINILPDSADPTSVNGKVGFVLKGLSSIKVEQIPSFEGAFVTDGVNDLITSTKTVQEMLGGSNEITVVSMIHQIGFISSRNYARNNYFIQGSDFLTNTISAIGKIGIYGYKGNLSNIAIVNDILGDKKDYSVDKSNPANIDSVFSVNGTHSSAQLSSVAWYWTIIANKVLTTDEINQVIAYFNLDRTLKPDILCNIGKQGITNDNHAEFNDKLIDYSGNGRDIQMNNLAWKGGSGIAAKQYETFKDWTSEFSSTSIITQIDEFTRIVESTTNGYWVSRIRRDSDLNKVYDAINVYLYQDNNFLVHECKYEVDGIKYAIPINESVGKGYHKLEMYTKDRYTKLPENAENVVLSEWYFPKSTKGSIKYSVIPSYKGGILLDGINDFGKVTGMPVYKDYTIIADYERFYLEPITGGRASILSKSSKIGDGSFIFNLESQNGDKACYTFGEANGNISDDITRIIRYQSKYYNTKTLSIGTAEDNDFMVLGKVREVDNRYFYGAIYSLMSFPYSMSEFLIERQLKKHKLGTLYPNMVEFRPVIKANDNYKIFYTAMLPLTGDIWERINIGDYVPVGRRIAIQMSFDNEAKKLVSAVSSQLGNITIVKNSNNIGYTIFGDVLKDKSPQKISITIEQDENYVLFNPVINSNYKYISLDFFLNNYQKKINIGDYIPKDAYLRANLYLNNNVDELAEFTFNGVSIGYSRSITVDTAFNIGHIYNYDSPQEVNITIDEYIRYEDIVQPYPVIFQITDRNTNQRYSWGDKIKVGSSIRLSQSEKPNLLSGLYSIKSYEYEGETYSYNQLTNLNIILTKQSISLSCNKTWLLDDNEPKCILSPRLLRIPNSSYKILGYIPDISGHGNHGKINNSAYAEGSGVNEDGSYQFDGVDDSVTIPTTVGGKQVLMKVNWQSGVGAVTLYDQRLNISDYEFAIYNGTRDLDDNPVMAYQGRNNGQTYIDGILNSNIMASELKAITHNITITNELSLGTNNTYPVIGSTRSNTHFAQMSLYDFMLFDGISTDDKIKELNEYVGIEAKVELPPYYWDTYGKTNSDEDKATIQQRGVAVGDYDLTNYNHAYEGMSGYNGYPVVFGANKTWEILSSVYSYISDVTSTTIHVTMVKNAGTGLLFSYVKKDEALTNIKEIPAFRVTIKGLEGNSKFGYRYLATEDATIETLVYLGNGTHELAKSFAPTEALLDLTRNAWVGMFITPMVEGEVVFDCDITIEVLPEYENGLAYDGITDYSKNANIPVLTDYTYIYKRTIINIPTNAATLLKGADKTNGGAFIADYGNKWQFNFGQYNIIQGIADGINWQTVNSFNGTSINKGENTDDSGITVAKFSNGYTSMVFYKLILYPKTISLLEINFLKNLMEKDEIIDLNNPIFIKNE